MDKSLHLVLLIPYECSCKFASNGNVEETVFNIGKIVIPFVNVVDYYKRSVVINYS